MAFSWPDPPAPFRDEHGQIPSWLQLRFRSDWQGFDWHCSLCGMWADSGHLGGHKHKNRLAQIAAVEAPVRDAIGRVPDWLVMKDWPDAGGRSWYCELCGAFAEVSHLESAKHLSKVLWWQAQQCAADQQVSHTRSLMSSFLRRIWR